MTFALPILFKLDRMERRSHPAMTTTFALSTRVRLANHFVMPGRMFLERFLSQRNIILNVSAVVWNRELLLQTMASLQGELPNYRVAGDWRLYTEVCAQNARIGFVARALNHHRRHAHSATHAQRRLVQLQEVTSVHKVIRENSWRQGFIRQKQDAYAKELAHQFGLRNNKEKQMPTVVGMSSLA